MRVYLDVCCLHRPFDDQSQARIRLETEAVKLVFDLFAKQSLQWISSDAVEEETFRNPNPGTRARIGLLLQQAHERLELDDRALDTARSFTAQGIKAMDALHLALAVVGGGDVLLTTDDMFLKAARRLQPRLEMRIENPANWIVEILES